MLSSRRWSALGAAQTLSISSLQPTSGGNTGSVTLSIQGGGFHNGLAVNLVGGTTITGSSPLVGTEGQTISVPFDLAGATVGSYALVVVNPDGTTTTLASAFTVQQGGAPNIQSIRGHRVGRHSTGLRLTPSWK